MPEESGMAAQPSAGSIGPSHDTVQQPPTNDPGKSEEQKQASTTAILAMAQKTPTAEANLSNADLKKIKKAEKAAKRAQAKTDSGAPSQAQVEPPSEAGKQQKGGATSSSGTSKGQQSQQQQQQQKKQQQQQQHRNSVSKPLPHRPLKESSEKPTSKTPAKSRESRKQVALFGHLYDKPRRTTLESAGKDVHPAVLALGLKFSSYAICGSTARCVAMLLAFKRVISSYTTPANTSLPRHLTLHLSPQIEFLVSCRPLATSMGNAIRWLKLEINDVDPDTDEDEAKADLCESIDIFIRERITAAGQVISNTAQEKIQDGDVILTFAKSKIVQQTFLQAFKRGRRFQVIVVDSRPLHEGKKMAKSLSEIGLDVTYSTTHSISHLVDRATRVFLGAHSMLGNGRLYSRAGSAMIAMMAKAADVPVIVCCESIKFTDRVALDSIVINEVAPPEELLFETQQSTALGDWKSSPNLQLLNLMYDVTPAEYISLVITEHGSLPPSSVPVVHRMSTNT